MEIQQISFGTDGVRGKFPTTISPKLAYSIGVSVANSISHADEFLIGRDTRQSGPALFSALKQGITSRGSKVRDLGIIPTPGVAVLAQKYNVPAVVITASHNPAEDNGIKIFGVGGQKITSDKEQEIELTVNELLKTDVEIDNTQSEVSTNESVFEYVEYLIENSDRPNLEGLKIVLDCANGAAHFAAPEAFNSTGATIFSINTESDGKRINDNCGAVHLGDLSNAVVSYEADIGFAYDGDADRVIAVDDSGQIINGDLILALFALEMKETSKLTNNAVVATTMSNGALREFLAGHSIELVETDVGDKYVLAEMINGSYTLGGEQSGHIIRTDKQFWGDGILNSLLLANIVKNKVNAGVESTANAMNLFTPFFQIHDKVHVKNKSHAENNSEISALRESLKKELGENSRIIIRPSGTEEVVRITIESQQEAQAKVAIDHLKEVITKVCN